MSDTPRTDRAEAFDDSGRMVSASFARTLERELAAAVARAEKAEAERDLLVRSDSLLSSSDALLKASEEHVASAVESDDISDWADTLQSMESAMQAYREARTASAAISGKDPA